VLDHIGSFLRFSLNDVVTFNPCGLAESRYLDLDQFDVVVIHYSIFIISDYYLAPAFKEKIREFAGLKVQFIQDEYRWVDRMSATMRELGVNVLFTCVGQSSLPKIWSEVRLPGVLKVPTLTGYVPEALAAIRVPLLRDRSLEIGYRGRDVPWWLGQLGQEKIRIGQGVLERAGTYRLRCDIAWTEDRRIYGQKWVRFIASCRAVLGTESGASITDFDGSIEAAVKDYLRDHPQADFEEVERVVLAPHEGIAPVIAISPRAFEAASLRTAQILFPGEYSGILEPWVHYIPLEKDFSNLDDVVRSLRDDSFVARMIETAHRDLVQSGAFSYRTFIRGFDDLIGRLASRRVSDGKRGFRRARLERALTMAALSTRTHMVPVVAPVVRAGISARLILGVPGSLRLMAAYAFDRRLRRHVPARQIFRDLLRLGLLASGQSRRIAHPFRLGVMVDRAMRRLRFESLPVHARREEGVSDVPGDRMFGIELLRTGGATLEWDHRMVGSQTSYRSGLSLWEIAIGRDGIYRFAAFESLARVRPKIVSRIVVPLLGRAEVVRSPG
jgi:hypothetical protein